MKKIIFIVGAAALLLAMNSCNTTKNAQTTAADTVSLATAVATLAGDASAQVDKALVDRHWRLVELFGKQVAPVVNNKEAYIVFNAKDNRFSGDAGCNRIMGSYQTTDNFRIAFSQVATTQMMCINMDVETQFVQVINTADSYVVCGDTLSLIRARMAPLARFVAVKQP